MTIKEMREKRAGLVNQMRSLLNTAQAAKRDLTVDEQKTYDDMEKEVDTLGRQIEREDRLAITENSLRERRDHNYRPGGDVVSDPRELRNSKEYRNSLFGAYARFGKNGLLAEHVNALSVGSDVDGGYLVPEEFETRLIEALSASDPVRAASTVVRTASDRNIPVESDIGSFDYVGEGGTYGESSPTVGRVVLSAFKSGGIIKVSEELLQDSAFGIEAYLQRVAGRRYESLEQTAFATGNGAGRPLGLFVTSAVAGTSLQTYTGGVSASPAITADDLMETFHKLARQYRDRAIWLTSDTMVKMIRKLKTGVSGDNTYLWQPGLSAGQPDRILNRPIFVTDGAPAPAVSTASIVFGDLSYYMIVDRIGMSMQVLKELYAASGQVGFRFSKRTDARLTFAPAVVKFVHGAAS